MMRNGLSLKLFCQGNLKYNKLHAITIIFTKTFIYGFCIYELQLEVYMENKNS